ncbi:hypothetical protein SAMN05443572_10120 [Myxococcus fulvus]|uniref:Lipoprotein n=1 Tax=Myxococcus fulvus TaxID=33 RepID=A0A511T1D3_MYXFU|nr:hypothetical protein [Myxococcus fulvus]GEN07954.1 hypothetical protein MFU01_29910 [Myxococcus fulvus]SES73996.1 hypothetical protein SAMN05443572_10120 [Myxococcus fulvus]
MRRPPRGTVLLPLGLLLVGCASPNPWVRVTRRADGILVVDGPAAGPFDTQEELARNACELVTAQPGAATGRQGMEYCVLWYYVKEEGKYFISYLSDVGGNRASGRKYREVPRALNAPTQGDVLLLGPGHNHPHNRQFSPEDLGSGRSPGWSPQGPSRFHDPVTRRTWDRELLVFFKEWDGNCTTYRYNYATRVVSALRDGAWVPIGKVEGEWGDLKMFEGQDWLP